MFSGDGLCDGENNDEACFFDGGDCCLLDPDWSIWEDKGPPEWTLCSECQCLQ